MPLQQSIDLARADRVGKEGIAEDVLARALTRTGEALDWLRARHADGALPLPLLRLPAETDDLDAIVQAAEKLRRGATDIVLLGTGGSSLGG
ncbi:MAG: glucose-6-phosphate isomerase, partial [Rhizobiales bacterium]|nr:glucose-6-phosphate isomerase [Hyphomicrobiales bacterium]